MTALTKQIIAKAQFSLQPLLDAINSGGSDDQAALKINDIMNWHRLGYLDTRTDANGRRAYSFRSAVHIAVLHAMKQCGVALAAGTKCLPFVDECLADRVTQKDYPAFRREQGAFRIFVRFNRGEAYIERARDNLKSNTLASIYRAMPVHIEVNVDVIVQSVGDGLLGVDG